MKARRSIGEDYDCKYEWDFSVQCGDSGVVFSKTGGYRTAFFEAFPKNPSCFLRGEGATIEEAEKECWEKYQKVISCDHEMERRDRTDGYGYCKHCTYSSMVFEPLTKCCKCNTPTRHAQDHKGKSYCKKHARIMPKNPKPSYFDMVHHRRPRKFKKQLKEAAQLKFKYTCDYESKVIMSVNCINSVELKCKDKVIKLMFREQVKRLLNLRKLLKP